jgi:hypothetical protein
MGTAQVAFAVVLCGGATGSDVTGSDVSHVTGSDVSHVTCPEACSRRAKHIASHTIIPLVFDLVYHLFSGLE